MKRLLPPPGLPRSLALQSMISALGAGTFLAGSAVYFLKVVGLTPTQVGWGLSFSGLLSFVLAVPLGVLADRLGGQRTWLIATCFEATIYAIYPLAHGFPMFLGVVALLAIVESSASGGRTAYTIAALPGDLRVRSLAFVRTAQNIGFSAGAAIAGVALVINETWAFHAMVLLNSLALLVNAFFVARLPHVLTERVSASPRNGPRVLRDKAFLALSALNGLLQSHTTLLLVVIPLWMIARTDAPPVLRALLDIMNPALVIALQVLASRGTESLPGAMRALLRSGVLLAAGCTVIAVSGGTEGWVTIGVLVAGYVLLTGAELLQSAGQWGVSALIPHEQRRAEYLGGLRLGLQAQRMLGPALLTGVTMAWGFQGWLIAGIVPLLAGLAVKPIAERALAFPAPAPAIAG